MAMRVKQGIRAKEAKEWAKNAGIPILWHIATTPFDPDLQIDEKAIRENIRWAKQLGCKAIGLSGNVGEAYALSLEERRRVLEISIDEDRGESVFFAFPVCDSLPETIKLTQHAQSAGADMVLVNVPFEHVKTHEQIYDYYKVLAENTDVAICLFSTWHSGYIMPPELIKKLAEDIPAVCAIKSVPSTFDETIEVWRQCGEMIQVSPCLESRWLEVVTQYEGMGRFLMNTGCTLMQAPGYTPIKDYVELALAGDVLRARDLYDGLQPLRLAWQEIYRGLTSGHSYRHPPARIKRWQDCLGMRGGQVRPPAEKLTAEDSAFIERELRKSPLAPYLKKE